jgi:hypothetical protein
LESICDGFNPLIDETFFLHPKPRVEKLANVQTSAFFNMFLTPFDRKIALQAQESNQRRNFLPLCYSEWTESSMVATSKHPYVEKQGNSTVELFFNSKDIKYKIEIIKNPDHSAHNFITLFSLSPVNTKGGKIEPATLCVIANILTTIRCKSCGKPRAVYVVGGGAKWMDTDKNLVTS